MSETSSTKDRIVKVASELWHSRNYDGVGVAEICSEAAVHKGSFFHFFRSKDDLLLAVLDHHRQTLKEHILGPSFATDVPPLDRFRRYFAAIANIAKEQTSETGIVRGCPIGNIAAEMSTKSETIRQYVAKIFDDLQAVFRKTLREAVKTGDLPANTDVKTAATALVVYIQGMAVLSKTYNQPALLRRLGEQALALAGIPPGA